MIWWFECGYNESFHHCRWKCISLRREFLLVDVISGKLFQLRPSSSSSSCFSTKMIDCDAINLMTLSGGQWSGSMRPMTSQTRWINVMQRADGPMSIAQDRKWMSRVSGRRGKFLGKMWRAKELSVLIDLSRDQYCDGWRRRVTWHVAGACVVLMTWLWTNWVGFASHLHRPWLEFDTIFAHKLQKSIKSNELEQ